MKANLIKIEYEYRLRTQGFLKGSTNHELIDSLNVEEGNIRYKLSIKNCQAIERGYDLDELADEKYNGHFMAIDWQLEKRGFKEGFQKALELIGDNKFSEEDVRKAIEIARNGSMQEQHNGYGRPTELRFVLDDVPSDDIIKSLQQTEWEVEIEMEPYHDGEFVDDGNTHIFEPKFRPALDSDGCLILKRI